MGRGEAFSGVRCAPPAVPEEGADYQLPEFGLFDRGLISVRSVMDLRWPVGPSSVVSGRNGGLRRPQGQDNLFFRETTLPNQAFRPY